MVLAVKLSVWREATHVSLVPRLSRAWAEYVCMVTSQVLEVTKCVVINVEGLFESGELRDKQKLCAVPHQVYPEKMQYTNTSCSYNLVFCNVIIAGHLV